VSALILDAGALIGIDRGDRSMIARVVVARRRGDTLRTNAMVVAQVWRNADGRQAVLANVLRAVEVRVVDEALGREAGRLLGMSGTSDPIDATVVLLARPGDRIVTSDVDDIRVLAESAGVRVTIVTC
jgi:hypothetical protein